MPRILSAAIVWHGLVCVFTAIGCETEIRHSDTQYGQQAQATLTRRAADLAQPSPYFLIDSHTGKLRQKGWLPAGRRVSRFLGLPGGISVVQGTMLEIVDLSPPAFVLSGALQDPLAPTMQQLQLPLQSAHSCPGLGLDSTGRLGQVVNRSISNAAVLGRVGNYALVSDANDIRFLSEHCLVPVEEFERLDTFVSRDKYYSVPHANPQDPSQAIQLGADIETKNLELIAQWFRPPDVDDSSWLTLQLPARVLQLRSTLAIVTQRLERGGSIDLPHEKASGWVKTRLAPVFLANTLDCEGLSRQGYVVEVKIDPVHLTTTLNELVGMLDTLRLLGLTDGSRHVHVSFPVLGITSDTARSYVNYYQYINEYVTVFHLAHFGANASLHKYFRPILADDVELAHMWLSSNATPTLLDEHTFRHVAFRTPALYGANRFGFEIRAFANSDALTAQLDVVAMTIIFLLNPKAHIETMFGNLIRMEDFTPSDSRVETLSRPIVDRLPTEIRSFLIQLEGVTDPEHEFDPPASVVWAMPLVSWWERAFLTQLRPRLEQARDEYVDELQRYLTLAQGNAPPSDEDLIQMVSSALSGWAAETGLWQHFRGHPTLSP